MFILYIFLANYIGAFLVLAVLFLICCLLSRRILPESDEGMRKVILQTGHDSSLGKRLLLSVGTHVFTFIFSVAWNSMEVLKNLVQSTTFC